MSARSVMVVHREAMVAEAVALALTRYQGIAAVAVATNELEAERLGERVDAVALDCELPGSTALASRLRRRGARVVLLGDGRAGEDEFVVSTSRSLDRLAFTLVPTSAPGPARNGRRSWRDLTPREQQVLALVARGLAAKQVAQRMGISPKTVEQYKTRIYAKLGVPNQTAAVSMALANGLTRREAWNRSTI
jgi:two-component system, NarL family, nitrate/nitrite response regulator NarL